MANVFDSFETEFFRLKSNDDPRVYQIHSSFLKNKGGILATVPKGNFKEMKDRTYTFDNTTTGTVARFVEWAHRGDYSAKLPTKYTEEDLPSCASSAEKCNKEEPTVESTAKRIQTTLVHDNHPFLSHARVYVFADTYLIVDLKKKAFERLTKEIQLINYDNDLDHNFAITNLLDYCFSNLQKSDDLLDYLGHYAAYRLAFLRNTTGFVDIMPKVGYAVLPWVSPCESSPWDENLPDPNGKLPHYTGR